MRQSQVVLLIVLLLAPSFAGAAQDSEKLRTNGLGQCFVYFEPTKEAPVGLWFGTCEVSQEQYEAVMGENPSFSKGKKLPVEGVTWDEAQRFCKRLTEKERSSGRLPANQAYHLPSAKQWKIAAAPALYDIKKDKKTESVAWYADNGSYRTHPVATREATSSGRYNVKDIYDILGNVSEWCRDEFEGSPGRRVVMGPSYVNSSSAFDSDFALAEPPTVRLPTLGFRCVIEQAMPERSQREEDFTNDSGIAMLWLAPGGSFLQGSKPHFSSQAPQRKIHFEKGFWLAACEVTQGQYEAIMQSNPSKHRGSKLPVESVTFDEAREFCRRLTEEERKAGRLPEGYVYSLPSEAQWEYACRAGTLLENPVNPFDKEVAEWLFCNSDGRTHRVGTKEANRWGFHDMLGNVRELVLDGNRSGEQGPSDGRPWRRGKNELATVRGFDAHIKRNRPSVCERSRVDSSKGDPFLGFRCALMHETLLGLAPKPKPKPPKRPSPVVEPSKDSVPQAPAFGSSVGMRFVKLPSGSFLLGSPPDEYGRDSNEGPQQRVVFEEGFWMAACEVTSIQYQKVMGRSPSQIFDSSRVGYPVTNVSWSDARAFCHQLSKRERGRGILPDGYRYALPTEAAWEYACRAGTTGKRYPGKISEIAWYAYNSHGMPRPVGKKQANPWGLYDMLGNVSEWCRDAWHDTWRPDGVNETSAAPERAVRGSNWKSSASKCRAALRRGIPVDTKDQRLGFRVMVVSDAGD